jgi:hypothetical protein
MEQVFTIRNLHLQDVCSCNYERNSPLFTIWSKPNDILSSIAKRCIAPSWRIFEHLAKRHRDRSRNPQKITKPQKTAKVEAKKKILNPNFYHTKFRPCTWSNSLVNLNVKTFEYVNKSGPQSKPNIKISSIGLKSHFEEEVDIEAKYLHNLETSFHSKENEQMNMIGELMAVTLHDT